MNSGRHWLMLILLLCAAGAWASDISDAHVLKVYDDAFRRTAAWEIDKPMLSFTSTGYVEVSDGKTVSVGRRFLEKLADESDGDRLLQFVFIHELRHVEQRKGRRAASALAMECESDFYAHLLTSRGILNDTSDLLTSARLTTALGLQSLGPKLASFGEASGSHPHLTEAQRFTIGAYGTWRAVNEWLKASGNNKEARYQELVTRSTSFTLPDEPLPDWVAHFCALVELQGAVRDSHVTIGPVDTDFLFDAKPGFENVTHKYTVKNTWDRPIKFIARPLTGIRRKGEDKSFASYAAAFSEYVEMDLQPGESKTVSVKGMFLNRMAESRELFFWSGPYEDQFVYSVAATGARQEPANCASSWQASSPPNEVHSFLLRAGAAAMRDFGGFLGDNKYPTMPDFGGPRFHKWLDLPRSANAEDSYIVVQRSGPMSGMLSLTRKVPREEALRVFESELRQFRSECQVVEVLSESDKGDGERSLTVRRLTIFSSTTLYLSKEKDEADQKDRYSVSWVINPQP